MEELSILITLMLAVLLAANDKVTFRTKLTPIGLIFRIVEVCVHRLGDYRKSWSINGDSVSPATEGTSD